MGGWFSCQRPNEKKKYKVSPPLSTFLSHQHTTHKKVESEQNWKAPPMLLPFSTQIYSHKTHKNQRKEFADCYTHSDQTFQTEKQTEQLKICNATARSDNKNTAWTTKDL
jgi:hypothetical protein